jgi:hypothetical protein
VVSGYGFEAHLKAFLSRMYDPIAAMTLSKTELSLWGTEKCLQLNHSAKARKVIS